METFKTKAGTELPLTDIKGKPYLQVPYRVQWFREETGQDWCIQTEIVEMDDNHAIVKAMVINQNGKIVSMAHKREDKSHFADFLEKAESSAIGRALGFLGYGTQYALDLLEGERLADAPLPKKTPPKANPNLDAWRGLKIQGGTKHDMTFEQLFQEELTSNHKWARARLTELTDGKKVPESAIKYLDYIDVLGVSL